MTEDNEITEERPDRVYYTMIPNMIDDSNLSVYAYRLYGHIKRTAEEKGTCWQSTETLAENCNISTGEVSYAKHELEKAGLIKIVSIKTPTTGKYCHNITIVDIWEKNIQQYKKVPSPEVMPSPGEPMPSPHEPMGSPHETKKNPLKKNPIKNDDDDDSFKFNNFINQHKDHYSEQKIRDALRKAEKRKPRDKFAYALGILENLPKDGPRPEQTEEERHKYGEDITLPTVDDDKDYSITEEEREWIKQH